MGGFSFPGLKMLFHVLLLLSRHVIHLANKQTTGVLLTSIQPYVKRFVVYRSIINQGKLAKNEAVSVTEATFSSKCYPHVLGLCLRHLVAAR